MSTLHGVVKNRRLEFDVPDGWPDGTQVEIFPVARPIDEPDEELTPEQIAQTLAAMDSFEALDMTEAEIEAWEADREARKALEKEQFNEHLDTLRRMWE